MKKKAIVGFYAVVLAMGMCVAAKDEAGVIAKYSGRYSTDALDDQLKEIRIAGHKVIRSQEDYVAFVSGIPKLEIAMTKGLSRKSDDPLLAMPQINFSNHMMVAVIRDGSMYLPPDIESVVVSNGMLTVNYSQRSLEEVAGLQEASGIGTYGAAVVPKAELKVAFKKRDIPAQPPSANGDGNPEPAGATIEKCPIHKVTFSKGPGQLAEGMTVSWTKEVYDAMEKYPYVRRNTWDSSTVKYCRSCEEEVENAVKPEKKASQQTK